MQYKLTPETVARKVSTDKIFSEHWPGTERHLHAHLLRQGIDGDIADDVVQDVAVEVLTLLRRGEHIAAREKNAELTLSAWFFGTARYAAMNSGRKDRRRENRVATSRLGEHAGDVVDPDSVEPSANEIDSEDVVAAISRLSTRAAYIVRQHHGIGGVEPRSLQSIADELGVSRQAVSQTYQGALKQLRQILSA